MNGLVYRRQWPVIDDELTLDQLAEEATPDLLFALAAAGVDQTAPPKWEIKTVAGERLLVVCVPCGRAEKGTRKQIDDDAIRHLIDEGVSVTRIATMLRVPRDLVELSILRGKHRANVDPDLIRQIEHERSLDDLGLTNRDRMWRDGTAA